MLQHLDAILQTFTSQKAAQDQQQSNVFQMALIAASTRCAEISGSNVDGLCCQKEYCSGQPFSFLLISLRHMGFSQRQSKNVTHCNE